MAPPYVEAFRGYLTRMAATYLCGFAFAYSRAYGTGPQYNGALRAYEEILSTYKEEILLAAGAGINKYLNSYRIRANQTADEFKLIYFVGAAICPQLEKAGLRDLMPVHLGMMIGMLDARLRSLNIDRPKLRLAMYRLAKEKILFEELGTTGCYLTYKTVSTAVLESRAALVTDQPYTE